MEAINGELMDEWLTYKVECNGIAASSHFEYTKHIKRFIDFIERREKTLLTVQPEDILAYKKNFNAHMPNTIFTAMSIVNSFYRWASDPTICKVLKSPVPPMRLESPNKIPHDIPKAEQIWKIRNRVQKLADAVLFEVLISSGMRIEEFLQLRAADIDFSRKCIDHELGKPSPFVGAVIELSPMDGMQIKRRKARTVFISVLAAKLLKLWMERNGIDPDTLNPVFPFNQGSCWDWVSALGKGIIDHQVIKQQRQQRKAAFLDIDVDKIQGATDEYKNRIRKLQEKELKKQKDFPGREEAAKLTPVKRAILNLHGLRHTFGNVQYYRNYYGNRRDIITVRDLMGHTNVSTTDVYVSSMPVVTNDTEWRRIFLGNGFEYRRIIVGDEPVRRSYPK